jgi:preprotein translocase subunit SecD
MIGILATLFTQILVSRAMIEIATDGGKSHFSFGQSKVIQA